MNDKLFQSGNRTHKSIIRSFLELLTKKDFSKICIADILTEAGISKGTFYSHFSDKYDLLMQAYDFFFNDLKKNFMTNSLFSSLEQCTLFINSNRFYYISLMKIENEYVSIKEKFKEDLETYYSLQNPSYSALDVSLLASQAICLLDYLTSLKRTITKNDIISLHDSKKNSNSFRLVYSI